MWKMAGVGAALTAAMLAAGGVALAGDTAKPETQSETSTEEMELQSGSEESHPLTHVRGEQARQLQEGLKEQGFYDGEIDGILGPLSKEGLKKFQESKGFDASGKLDSETASALGIELSDVQPVRGTEEPLKEEAEPEATPMIDTGLDETSTEEDALEPQSGEEDVSSEETDLQSGEASDEATGTGSMNTGADEEILEPGQHPATENQPMGGVEGQDDPNVVNESEIEPQAGTSTTFDKKTIKKVEEALKEKKLFTGKVDGILDTETTEAIRKFQTDNGIVATGQLDARTLDALGVKSGTDTKIDMQGGSTDPGEMTTPEPGEAPTPGEPTEPTDPLNPNEPVPPNPGDMTPQ